MEKLLILGASEGEIDIVQRAKAMGIYTIVTDYNLDHRLSPAKDVADEYWDIDWSDMEALAERCIAENVTGITAGYSEIRIDNLIRLCKRLGKPCYSTLEQQDIIRDKIKFKEMCRDCGIPVVEQYASVDDVNHFPVIVKPTDRGGAIGISVVYHRSEFLAAYNTAMESSLSKHVIIEDFISDGQEVNFLYGIVNGNIDFLFSFDSITSTISENMRDSICLVGLAPSKYETLGLRKLDAGVKKMVEKMGIRYGTLFLSGFITGSNELSVFEGAFRLGGYKLEQYCILKDGYSPKDIYIRSALGLPDPFLLQQKMNEGLRNVDLGVYAKEGRIGSVVGEQYIKEMPDLTTSFFAKEGCEFGKKITMATSIAARFEFLSKDSKSLADDLKNAYNKLRILDENGEDMIVDRLDPDLVRTWWD